MVCQEQPGAGAANRHGDTNVVYSSGTGRSEGAIVEGNSGRRGSSRRARTDQHLLQRTLLGEAVDEAPFAVFVFDEDRNYVAVNEAACTLTGYTRRELLELDALALGSESARSERWLRELRTGRRASGRGTILRKDGTTIGVTYRVGTTRVAGAEFFISICWPTGATTRR